MDPPNTTLLPQLFCTIQLESYDGHSFQEFKDIPVSIVSYEIKLPVGKWSVFAEAGQEGINYRGSELVELKPGENKQLKIILKRDENNSYELPLKNIESIAPYLMMQLGNEANPASLPLAFALNESNLREILLILENSQKFVKLDLSDCTASNSSTEGGLRADGTFDTMKDITFGKYYIAEITLPKSAKKLIDGTYAGTNITFYPFQFFTNLKAIIITKLEHTGNFAFYDCDKLTQINLPEGLLSVGNNAFQGCTSLRELHLPLSLKTIGAAAFIKGSVILGWA